MASVDVSGDRELRARLRQIIEADKRQTLGEIGRMLETRIRLGFRSSTDPYGQRWHPLARRRGRPLLDTARLRNSITYAVGENDVRAGTNVKYGRPHQEGRSGTERVRAHERTVRQVFGRQLAAPVRVNVRGHARRVNTSARMFLPSDRRGGLPSAWRDDLLAILRRSYGFGD